MSQIFSQQPTANSQQPTANSQQPTANSQQPTANSQQPTANSQQPVSQLRRARVSVPSLIAEGCGRRTDKDFGGFIDKSMGSLFEIETQILIAQNLGYINNPEAVERIINLTSTIVKIQNKLLQKLR